MAETVFHQTSSIVYSSKIFPRIEVKVYDFVSCSKREVREITLFSPSLQQDRSRYFFFARLQIRLRTQGLSVLTQRGFVSARSVRVICLCPTSGTEDPTTTPIDNRCTLWEVHPFAGKFIIHTSPLHMSRKCGRRAVEICAESPSPLCLQPGLESAQGTPPQLWIPQLRFPSLLFTRPLVRDEGLEYKLVPSFQHVFYSILHRTQLTGNANRHRDHSPIAKCQIVDLKFRCLDFKDVLEGISYCSTKFKLDMSRGQSISRGYYLLAWQLARPKYVKLGLRRVFFNVVKSYQGTLSETCHQELSLKTIPIVIIDLEDVQVVRVNDY